MKKGHRSGCPINLGLELFGDRWTLLILRDMMFAEKRHFREFLSSAEGIASNILADRLAMLVDAGILTRHDDPGHKLKAVYALTDKGIDLLPVISEISIFSRKYLPVDPALLGNGVAHGSDKVSAMEAKMEQLRRDHLGTLSRSAPDAERAAGSSQ